MAIALFLLSLIAFALAKPPFEISGSRPGGPCPEGEVKCKTGKLQCIFEINRCDGFADCNDGSDEGEHCKDYQCPEDYTKCDDNLACVKESYFCDGYQDCLDLSDEQNCPGDEEERKRKMGYLNVKKVENTLEDTKVKQPALKSFGNSRFYNENLPEELARLMQSKK